VDKPWLPNCRFNFLPPVLSVAWWRSRYGVGLVIYHSQVQSPAVPLSYSHPRQVLHTHASVHQTVWTGTGQGWWCSEAGKVTAGLAASNDSILLVGVWLTSPVGCLSRKPDISTDPYGPWDFGCTFTLMATCPFNFLYVCSDPISPFDRWELLTSSLTPP